MVSAILEYLAAFIIAVISGSGYFGIVLLMAIESACIPLPSEVIMPFSGYLVFKGQFRLFWVGLAGALGCNLGSLVAYYVGSFGGRPLVEKYGRWLLVTHHDLELADPSLPAMAMAPCSSRACCRWSAPSLPSRRVSHA